MAAAAPSELMLVWWDWELGRGVLCVEMGGAASEVMGGDWVISDQASVFSPSIPWQVLVVGQDG